MRVVEGWSELVPTICPLGLCDGYVRIDRREWVCLTTRAQKGPVHLAEGPTMDALWRRWLDDFNESLPASVFAHVVLVIAGKVGEITDLVDQLLAAMDTDRQVRLLVGLELASAPAARRWPVAAVAVSSANELRELLSKPFDDSQRVVHISPSALAGDLLDTLRRAIIASHRTTFVFGGLADQYWRFAALLASTVPNVMLDTSHLSNRRLRSMFTNRYQLARLMSDLQEKIIFASGFPSLRPLGLLRSLVPWFNDPNALAAVLRDNAMRLYFQ